MKKKMALITGASRGIGAATAEVLAEHGYDLTLTCIRSEDRLSEFAAYLSIRYSISAQTFVGDISSYASVVDLFSGIDDIDVLINNAGIAYSGLLQDMDPGEWNRVIGVNLNSAFYTCKLAIPLMLKKKSGKIINISSVWGRSGASMEVAYSASKGGLNAFTKALARELAPSNIQVNAVACGLIDTDMNSVYSKEDLDGIIDEIPANRAGRPEEAARLIYSVCEGPEYMTGQIISLDGGWI
ncbi:MAG: SDR family NAD(P)-dependent oxidoreductase [Lachnospiraceae bacterium]|nr:SDR family NAD(P)-dependent oxidoreductase [Lachnospiraceae bacterium]